MVLESGTRVSVAYTRERVRGVTPAGIATAALNIAVVANGGASGLSRGHLVPDFRVAALSRRRSPQDLICALLAIPA